MSTAIAWLHECVSPPISLALVKPAPDLGLLDCSSFFYIRLLRNPAHYVKSLGAAYKVKEGPAKALEQFVKDAFASLQQVGLIEHDESNDSVGSTGLGEVMSKRFIRECLLRCHFIPRLN